MEPIKLDDVSAEARKLAVAWGEAQHLDMINTMQLGRQIQHVVNLAMVEKDQRIKEYNTYVDSLQEQIQGLEFDSSKRIKELEEALKERQITPLKDFTKTCTKEEIDMATYLEWSDATLAAFCRSVSQHIFQADIKGFTGIRSMAACMILIGCAKSANAGSFETTLNGYTAGEPETPKSDWQIIVKKISK